MKISTINAVKLFAMLSLASLPSICCASIGDDRGHLVSRILESSESKDEQTIFAEHSSKESKSSNGSGGSKSSKSPSKNMKSGDKSSKAPKDGSDSRSTKSGKSAKGGSMPTSTAAPTMTRAPGQPSSTPGPTRPGVPSASRTSAPRPPTPITTGSPAAAPTTGSGSPAAAPTDGGGSDTAAPTEPEDAKTIILDRYAVAYSIPSGLPDPSRDNFDNLAIQTQAFLDDFLETAFDSTPMATYLSMTVDFVTSSATNGITVIFDSTANFTESSSDALTNSNSLGTTIEGAFEGQSAADYIAFLGANLPSANPFSRTTAVSNAAIVTPSSTNRSNTSDSSRGSHAARGAIIAGASGLIILTAGVILYRRGMNSDDEIEYVGKGFEKGIGKSNTMSGDATIAGETYTGDTFVSSPSYARDEEHGDMVNIDLDSATHTFDSSSVAPVWDEDESVMDNAAADNSTVPEDGFEDEICDNQDVAPTNSASRFSFGPSPSPSNSGGESHSETIVFSTNSAAQGDHDMEPQQRTMDSVPQSVSNYLQEAARADANNRATSDNSTSHHQFDKFFMEEFDESTAGSVHNEASNMTAGGTIDGEASARRPMSVAEIESLLSEEMSEADDISLSELSASPSHTGTFA